MPKNPAEKKCFSAAFQQAFRQTFRQASGGLCQSLIPRGPHYIRDVLYLYLVGPVGHNAVVLAPTTTSNTLANALRPPRFTVTSPSSFSGALPPAPDGRLWDGLRS